MRREFLFAALILAALYLWGLAPSVHVHDAGELTAGAWTLGIAHPPGAPLYMLISKPFLTLLPYGHIAWRANLLSAVFALAVFSLLLIWAEKRSGCRFTALTTATFAAFSPVFWSQALMAEVYTLQALLLVAVIVSFDLGWRPEITALLWGLLLACHVGLAPLTPILIFLLMHPVKGARARLTMLLKVTGALALPLTLYLYLPLRSLTNPAIDWGNPENLERLWWHLSNRNVRGRMLSLPLAAYLTRAIEYGGILTRNLHLGLLAGLLTAITYAWRSRTVLLCALIILYDAAFVVLLDTAPLASEAYGIPAVMACAMMLPFAFNNLRSWSAAPAAILISTLVVAAINAPEVLLNHSFVIRDSVEAVLDQVPHGAVLLTQEDNTTFPLAYLIAVEGARSDLKIYDRAGNLFESPYDRALFTVKQELADYRRQQEGPLIGALLKSGAEVWYATPFIEFRPSSWRIDHHGTVGRARLITQQQDGRFAKSPLELRRPSRPDWMSRQVLSMDNLRRAASHAQRAPALLELALELAEIGELKLLIAQVALHAGVPELAGRAALQAMHIAPDLAPAWSLSAHCELLKGNLQRAEELAGHAIQLDPRLPQPYSTLALIAVAQQRWELAKERFSAALHHGAYGPEPLVNRALVYEQLGLFDLAISDLKSAASFDTSCKEICVRRLDLIVKVDPAHYDLAAEICSALSCMTPSLIDDDTLIRLLTIAARAGFPSCVETWLDSFENASAATKRITDAYRRAQKAKFHQP